jgi:hypothetical protein
VGRRAVLDAVGLGGRIILEWITGRECVDWIHLAQDRVQWRTPVNTVINLLVL